MVGYFIFKSTLMGKREKTRLLCPIKTDLQSPRRQSKGSMGLGWGEWGMTWRKRDTGLQGMEGGRP